MSSACLYLHVQLRCPAQLVQSRRTQSLKQFEEFWKKTCDAIKMMNKEYKILRQPCCLLIHPGRMFSSDWGPCSTAVYKRLRYLTSLNSLQIEAIWICLHVYNKRIYWKYLCTQLLPLSCESARARVRKFSSQFCQTCRNDHLYETLGS